MSFYRTANHDTHDEQWSIHHSQDKDAVCFACLVEILETDDLLVVQKQPAMSELSSLLHSVDLLHQLQCNPNVSAHVILVLIDIMKADDQTFASVAMEVCLKMLVKLGSEEQVCSVVDLIQSYYESCQDHRKLLPLYLFLGRMMKMLPGLIEVLSVKHGTLLHYLSNALSCPDEEVQSAMVFIFVYIPEACWVEKLPVSIQHQVSQEAVHLLATAKSQCLIRNVLALLRKMVCSEDITNLLISLNVNSTGLISALKKHIVSKNGTHQMSAIQIISSILKHGAGLHAVTILKSDVIEFLFEALMTNKTEQIEYVLQCLFPLCQMDLFYTKCHSVYGLESILRVLNILMDMNNSDLIQNAMVILGIVLKRQPESVPLFISSGTVHSCLAVITRGIRNCNPHIFCPSVSAFQGIIRKNHLLLPVPFEEMKEILKILSEEIWQHVFSVSAPSKSKKIVITETYKPAEEFLRVCLSCTSLIEQCSEDPATSLSSFTGATTQQVQSSDQEFKTCVISVCVDSAISYAMKNLDEEDNPVLCELVLTLLCHLYSLDTEKTCHVVVRLTSVGFLTKVMELKSSSSCDRTTSNEHTVDKFLSMACGVLHRFDDKEAPLPDWIETGIHQANYRFEDLPQILTKLDVDYDTYQIYLFLLYHIYRQDHIPIQVNTLGEFLISSTNLLDRQLQLSPLVVKYFIFLWAFASCLSENQNEDSVKEFITKIATDMEPHTWYTHHPALLYWSCNDVILCKVFGTKIMELWIDTVTEKWSEEDIVDLTPVCSDFQQIYEMFASLDFIEIFMELFISSSERVIKAAAQILHHIINQVTQSNSKEVFFHHLNNQIKEFLQAAFLHCTSQCITETKINCLLSVLIKSYKEEMPELDAEDTKVLHHVIKWLSQSTECKVEVLQCCLQLICVYCQSQCVNSGNSVILLVIQNEEAVGNLDLLSKHPDRTVRVLTTKIITELINYQTKNPIVHKSHSRRVTLSLQPLEDKLNIHNLSELEATLQLLTALFNCKFDCQLVNLQNTGVFVEDMACPLISTDYTVLFSYLQQHILQDIPDVRRAAVDCFTAMINYLDGSQPDLANDLITHPWNTLLMEILIQTTDDISIAATIKFFQTFLDFPCGKMLLVKLPYLMKSLSKLLMNSSMKENSSEIEDLFSKV